METEEWREVDGYDGMYEVSSLGRVRSWRNNRWGRAEAPRLLKGGRVDGYPFVTLCNGGLEKTRTVHLLVAEAFIGPRPSPHHECRHLDGNSGNPRLDNLAWGTREENAADKKAHGTEARGETHGMHRLSEAEVLEIYARSQGEKELGPIAEDYGVSLVCVWQIANGTTWGWLTGAEVKLRRIKLTADDALDIFRRSRAGESTISLAEEYCVTPSNISAIKHGQNWAKVTGAAA